MIATEELEEPNAMTIATATKTGIPSARMVLLKDYSKGKFHKKILWINICLLLYQLTPGTLEQAWLQLAWFLSLAWSSQAFKINFSSMLDF